MTGEEHNKYLAYSLLAYGAIHTLLMAGMAAFFIVLFTSIPQSSGQEEVPLAIPIFFIGFIVMIQLFFVVPSLVAGYALLKRKRWARIAGIISAVLAGANFPLGTAVCVYALWFLISDKGKAMYDNQNITSQGYFPPHNWQGQAPPNLWADRSGDAAEPNDWRK
ncbi:MAG TPA: hypothetical protein VF131_09035 [Blastocatellia bacterium]|nr:hypothetical protein [Blastocatellia bacterium]